MLFLHIMKANEFKNLEKFILGIRIDHWLHAIMFIPLGFMVQFNLKNPITSLLFAIILGISFETIQYFLPYRSFDWTDITSDFTGTMIGYLIYLLLSRRINRVLYQNRDSL